MPKPKKIVIHLLPRVLDVGQRNPLVSQLWGSKKRALLSMAWFQNWRESIEAFSEVRAKILQQSYEPLVLTDGDVGRWCTYVVPMQPFTGEAVSEDSVQDEIRDQFLSLTHLSENPLVTNNFPEIRRWVFSDPAVKEKFHLQSQWKRYYEKPDKKGPLAQGHEFFDQFFRDFMVEQGVVDRRDQDFIIQVLCQDCLGLFNEVGAKGGQLFIHLGPEPPSLFFAAIKSIRRTEGARNQISIFPVYKFVGHENGNYCADLQPEIVVDLDSHQVFVRDMTVEITPIGEQGANSISPKLLSEMGLKARRVTKDADHYWIDELDAVDLFLGEEEVAPWKETAPIGPDYLELKLHEFLKKQPEQPEQPLSIIQERTFNAFFFSKVLNSQLLELGSGVIEKALKSQNAQLGLEPYQVECQGNPKIRLNWLPTGQCHLEIEMPLVLRKCNGEGVEIPGEGYSLGTVKYTGNISIALEGKIALEDFHASYESPRKSVSSQPNAIQQAINAIVGTEDLKGKISDISCAGPDWELSPDSMQLPFTFRPDIALAALSKASGGGKGYQELCQLRDQILPLRQEDRDAHRQPLVDSCVFTVALGNGRSAADVKSEAISDVRAHEVNSVLMCQVTLASHQESKPKVNYYLADYSDQRGTQHRKGDFAIEDVTQDDALLKTLCFMNRMGYTSVDIGGLSKTPKEGRVLSSQARVWLALQAIGLPAYVEGRLMTEMPSIPARDAQEIKTEAEALLRKWVITFPELITITENRKQQLLSKLENVDSHSRRLTVSEV